MRLGIEDNRAVRLASELARVTGESVSRAVPRAIEERLAREQAKPRGRRQGIAARLLALGDEVGRLPVLDDRPGDDIRYDEAGLPKGRDAERSLPTRRPLWPSSSMRTTPIISHRPSRRTMPP